MTLSLICRKLSRWWQTSTISYPDYHASVLCDGVPLF